MNAPVKKTVGILTGGGDCPGLNAVIRAVVKTGIGRHGWDVWGIEDAFHGLVDLARRSPRGTRRLSLADVEDILTKGGTILGTSNRADPFRFPRRPRELGGEVVLEDLSAAVLTNAKKLGLDALIVVGGDGTMAIASAFAQMGMNIVGVPKTIDNDLEGTDVTFGFDTAVQVASEALDRLRDTAESHERVMVVEVMGRNAGFIALHAGIAGGAHAILIPEIPYSVVPIARMIAARWEAGHHYTMIVVAEGAKPEGGTASVAGQLAGAMPKLGGAAARLGGELEAAMRGLDADVRVTVLGHVQRGGSPTNFDRTLGTRFGHAAAELVQRGEFGTMVGLRTPDIAAVPLAAAAAAKKRVNPKGQVVQAARALGVVFGDEG
jgi:phosphofructokinase-like protein